MLAPLGACRFSLIPQPQSAGGSLVPPTRCAGLARVRGTSRRAQSAQPHSARIDCSNTDGSSQWLRWAPPLTLRAPGHARAEDLGGLAVGGSDPRGVDAECRSTPAAVAEPTGDGPKVHSGRETGREHCSNCANVDRWPDGKLTRTAGAATR